MQSASPAVLASKGILVVDAPGAAGILVDALHAVGARVIGPACDALAALALLDRVGPIDVAVVDVDVAGDELQKLIGALRGQGVAVLPASQSGCASALAACEGLTASGKPVDLGMVAAALWIGP